MSRTSRRPAPSRRIDRPGRPTVRRVRCREVLERGRHHQPMAAAPCRPPVDHRWSNHRGRHAHPAPHHLHGHEPDQDDRWRRSSRGLRRGLHGGELSRWRSLSTHRMTTVRSGTSGSIEEYERASSWPRRPGSPGSVGRSQAGHQDVRRPEQPPRDLVPGLRAEVEWSDFSRSTNTKNERDCVSAGCFGDVYRIAESSDGEQGIFQLKSYAKGVGEIRVGWRGGGRSQEDLSLKSTADSTARG